MSLEESLSVGWRSRAEAESVTLKGLASVHAERETRTVVSANFMLSWVWKRGAGDECVRMLRVFSG